MSGIAEVLLDLGFKVSGSDKNESARLAHLRRAGATIYVGHRSEQIMGADAVVISSAVDSSNEEVREAEENKIPIVPRAEMLGELMRFRKGIAIAGTHGKTTTTSLISAVLVAAEMDPTFIVGGVVNSVNTNARLGAGEYLVAEADESDASFLHLQPQMSVVTNIDEDHMETYSGDFEILKKAYVDFLHNLPFYGLAILCFDDPVVKELAGQISKPVVSYGFAEGVDFRATNMIQKNSVSSFDVECNDGEKVRFSVSMPGKHNVLNALAAVAIGYKLGLPVEAIQKALSSFEGIGRRFQHLARITLTKGSVELVDDYAHHPRELSATLEAAYACWPGQRIIVAFQPHRYSRTRDLFDDFAQLLAGVDNLIVTEVYPAGEKPIASADGRSLCKAIRKRGKDPIFVESLSDLGDLLPSVLSDGDVLLTLGAGDIGRFAQSLAGSKLLFARGENQ
ncbi:MAG: UDP-N-acetylmuramate--L-alanine ligase [Gammaproteobacteria bacterium]|nr:UDP-N-acetylmuramate--L-alanine ligase [Gammaproteobacteria bacterium]